MMAYQTGEASLTKKIIDYFDDLQKKGLPLYYEHRSGSGGYGYKKGVPDFFFVINGTHVECELKTPTGKLSTMQEKFKWRCETEWKIAYVCPRTLEDLKEFLEPFLRTWNCL